jgi:hypothetical protein
MGESEFNASAGVMYAFAAYVSSLSPVSVLAKFFSLSLSSSAVLDTEASARERIDEQASGLYGSLQAHQKFLCSPFGKPRCRFNPKLC